MCRKKFFITIFIFWLGSLSVCAQNVWQQTRGPYEGFIRDVVYHDNALYATSRNGVFVSYNDGASFQSWGLKGSIISSLGSDSEFLYAAEWYTGFFRKKITSGDWERMPSSPPSRILDLKINQEGVLIAGTRLHGIFISYDQGANWKPANYNLPETTVHSVLLSDSNFIYVCLESYGIYKTSDLGTNWVFVSQNIPADLFTCVEEDTSGNLYVGVALSGWYGSGIYRSTNGGETWGYMGYNMHNIQTIYTAANGDIYFSSDHGFYKSTDGGWLWNPAGSGISSAVLTLSFCENPGGEIFIGTTAGLFKSSEQGNNFVKIGLPVMAVFSFTQKFNGNIVAGTDNGIYESSDFGNSWTEYQLYMQGIINSLIRTQSNSVIAGLEYLYGIYRCTIHNYWFWVMRDEYTTHDIKQTSSGNIYTASSEKLFMSRDDGQTWTQVNAPFINSLQSIETENDTLYLGTTQYGMYVSGDSGSTWYARNLGLNDYCINYLLKFREGKIFAATGSGIFLYTSGSWKDINIDATRRQTNHLFIADSLLYAATDSGIYYYNFYTEQWNSFNEGLGDLRILSLGTDKAGHLLAGTWNESVYRTSSPVLNYNDSQANEVPEEYKIFQNYPNPFNPSTRIKFTLPERASVSVCVYDMLGKLISEIINEEKSSGTYEVEFNGTDLPSGIYFCRMLTDNYSTVIKMLLLR